MKADTTVVLSSNGKYWQVFYYDGSGKRRAKSLGPKKKLSRRKARILCDRLAAELQLNPARAGFGKTPHLGEYLQRYLASRTDLRAGTLELHELTARYLLAQKYALMRLAALRQLIGVPRWLEEC
jgi:hypothetical protein